LLRTMRFKLFETKMFRVPNTSNFCGFIVPNTHNVMDEEHMSSQREYLRSAEISYILSECFLL
jgi:hypothetical protein